MDWYKTVQNLAKGLIENVRLKNVRKAFTVYDADGAIDPTADNVVLTKGSAAAMTLAAPSQGAEGHELTIVAGSAYAHVVTATDLIDDGVTGGAKDTITLGAFVGATATLIAYNKKWVLKSKTVATVAGA